MVVAGAVTVAVSRTLSQDDLYDGRIPPARFYGPLLPRIRNGFSASPSRDLVEPSLRPQQVTDGIRGRLMALGHQPSASTRSRLRAPPQPRHRITALVRLDQRQQRRRSPGSRSAARLALRRAAAPGPAAPRRIPLIDPQGHRRLAHPGSPGHQPDSAAQRPGLGPEYSRRRRSSRCGKIASNFAASISPVTSIARIPHHYAVIEDLLVIFREPLAKLILLQAESERSLTSLIVAGPSPPPAPVQGMARARSGAGSRLALGS